MFRHRVNRGEDVFFQDDDLKELFV